MELARRQLWGLSVSTKDPEEMWTWKFQEYRNRQRTLDGMRAQLGGTEAGEGAGGGSKVSSLGPQHIVGLLRISAVRGIFGVKTYPRNDPTGVLATEAM